MDVITPQRKEKLMKDAQTFLDSFLEQLESSKWEVVLQQDGFSIQYCYASNGYTVYRMEGIFEAPIEIVQQLCLQPELRTKWDMNCSESYRLAQVNQEPFVDIVYHSMKPLGGGYVSPRDFVDMRIERRENQRIIQAGASIEFEGCQNKEGFVRACNFPCGFVLEPLDEKRTRILTTTCHDLRGWLPYGVISSNTPAHLLQLSKDFRLSAETLAKEENPALVIAQ